MDEEEDDNGDISIHALREEGDRVPGYRTHHHPISIHALREEGDLHSGVVREGSSRISIHALREESDLHSGVVREGSSRISIHALREEGDPPGVELQAPRRGISIHALREEGDGMPLMMPAAVTNFYPRPPHGGRLTSTLLVISPAIFLSTPSSRRATCAHGPVSFSPIFLSTPSSRRATDYYWPVLANIGISIHALLTEGDPPSSKSGRPSENFYPRPPRGGRRWPPSPTP